MVGHRRHLDRELETIEAKVVDLFGMVCEDLPGLTEALLNGNNEASLVAELASGPMALPVTMEMTLVARLYQRLGDHAANIARRVIYLAGSTALVKSATGLAPGQAFDRKSRVSAWH